jgi:molecular chaperone HtpG
MTSGLSGLTGTIYRMPDDSAADSYTFQVDLRGLVDLLSQHLYSSPRVYIRELLQNAVDATTARGRTGTDTRIRIAIGDGGLRIEDQGIGLTEDEAHRFLATIGSSSKRDFMGARQEFLGQFGIGLLACFTVAETIRVVTRSAKDPDAKTIEWLATSDGTYGVRVLGDEQRSEPGTTVWLTPRHGAERWFEPDLVAELARDYGALLPYEVTVGSASSTVTTTEHPAVWDRAYASDRDRKAALLEYAAERLGFTPLDVIDLDVPIAGIRGAGFVLPRPASPAEGARHRVYLKGMLLSDATSGLLPDWAFFVRCVVDSDVLRPTASREGLYEDDTLGIVRESLGKRVREWLTGLAAEDPRRLDAFLNVHSLGVKALARHDRELAKIMLPHLRFESADGLVTLAEFARAHPKVYLAPTLEEFRQVAAIASAQGIGVINGGYTYDSELVGQLPDLVPGTIVETLDAPVIASALDTVEPDAELRLAGFLAKAREILDPLDCDVILRAYHPVAVSALYLDSRAARAERTRSEIAAEADDLWAEILGSLKSSGPRAQLVLNNHNPVVRRLAAIIDQPLLTAAVESLYGQALLMTHRPLRPTDAALLNRAFGELLARATARAGDEEETS